MMENYLSFLTGFPLYIVLCTLLNEYGKVCNVGNTINLLHTFWDRNVDAVHGAVEDKALHVTYPHSKLCEECLLVIPYF